MSTGHIALATGRYSPTQDFAAEVTEFEFSNKAVANYYMAVYRHTQVTAFATDREGVSLAAQDYWDSFFRKFRAPEVRRLLDYPAAAFLDDPNKRVMHYNNILHVLKTADFEKSCFTTMVKSGEVYYTSAP